MISWQCEDKYGVERCFTEDPEGREECPPEITTAFLTSGFNQHSCLAVCWRVPINLLWPLAFCIILIGEAPVARPSCVCPQEVKTHYCTVTCSGGDTIHWHAHDEKWCAEEKDRCPPVPPIIPVAEYKLKPWSQVIRPPMQCTRPAGGMPKISVLILAYKETEALTATLETYTQAGFLQVPCRYRKSRECTRCGR